jgi:hypothetical protein
MEGLGACDSQSNGNLTRLLHESPLDHLDRLLR